MKKSTDEFNNIKETILKNPLKQFLIHWGLMIVLWLLTFFSLNFIIEITNKWKSPTYLSSYPFQFGRLGEIIIFALCMVIVLYTINITLLILVYIFYERFKNIHYQAFTRMHNLVLIALIIHIVLFLIVFYRP